ncbi:MAG: hypothetical protein DI602_08365, partial [Aliarcobacter butzleri]
MKDYYFYENIIESNNINKKELLETLFLLYEYKNAIDKSSIVSKTNHKGVITFANDKFCKISGYSKEELIGKNHNILRHPNMPNEFFRKMWKTILNKKVFRDIITDKSKKGKTYYVDSTIIPIIDNDNNIIEFIGIRHDITEIFEKEKIIQKQFLDELTSLPNRQKLLNDLKNVINPKIAIINIDDFRNINDFYGFEIGDLLLKKFSDKLSQFKTKNLNIYRISSDIFVLLADKDFSLEKLKNISNFLIEDICKNPLYINQETFYLTLTIGVSSNINEKNNDNVLTKAEFAIYTAKNNNQNIFILDENISIYKSLKNNKELVKNLKNALLKDNLLIFGQKIINNHTNNIKYEILMRIKLEDGTILFPSSFLEVSKKAKFYLSMTKILVKKACEYFKDKNIEFSLNLTLEDLEDDYTINQIFETIAKTNTAKQITFEIVESEQIENFEKINKFIKDAKSLGCKIAIDDFGTGYSNFSYIAKLNIDI